MARSAPAPHNQGSLARLLSVEARLDTLLAEARERAGAIRSEAERQAAVGATVLEAELAEAAKQADVRRATDCAERLAALSQETDLALGHFRAIGPERITELARWVSEQVLDGALNGEVR